MGSILSYHIAGVEDNDIQVSLAYCYPPKSGEGRGKYQELIELCEEVIRMAE